MTKIITKYQENMKKKEILFIAIAAMSIISCQNNSKENKNCDTCQENCKNLEQEESSKIYDSAELIAPASYQWAYNVKDIPCVYHKNSNLLLLPGFDVNEQGEFTFALGEQTDVVRFQGTTLLERSKMEKEKYEQMCQNLAEKASPLKGKFFEEPGISYVGECALGHIYVRDYDYNYDSLYVVKADAEPYDIKAYQLPASEWIKDIAAQTPLDESHAEKPSNCRMPKFAVLLNEGGEFAPPTISTPYLHGNKIYFLGYEQHDQGDSIYVTEVDIEKL